MMDQMQMPAALDGIPDERLVDVDVRDDLRAGNEPFQKIMEARQALEPGQVLRVRAIFEPAPLYRVMAGQGLDHWTERLADDDWRVWFFEAGGEGNGEAAGDSPGADTSDAASAPGTPDSLQADDVMVLDVRGLEPPEPMVRTLEALEELPRGSTLVQVNVRVPQFLLPRLEERGFTYDIREQSSDLVRVFITHTIDEEHAEPVSTASSDTTPEDGAGSASDTAPETAVLDVRPIPPREKHPAIFETFDGLAEGESFILVNDHDPLPLRYQFQFEREGLFGWEYLEQGPTVWRVEISRTSEGA